MNERYSVLDPGAAGAGLRVQNAGSQVTTTSSGLNINRTVRGNIGVLDDDSNVEFIPFTLLDTAPSIANKISLGIVTADASLSTYVGGDAEGIGYRPAEGQIHTSGGSVASVTASGLSDVVSVAVVFSDTGASVAFYLDGTLLTTLALPAGMVGKTLYPAVSVGSDAAAGDIIVHVSAGFRAMQVPLSGLSGWWSAYPLRDADLIATGDYVSHHDDDQPNARFMGGVTERGFIERRSWSCWMWGEDDLTVRPGSIAFEVTDPEDVLKHLVSPVYRDDLVDVFIGDHADAMADFDSLGTARFDRMEVLDDLRRQIYLTDTIALFEGPLQQRDFRPDVAPQTANRVMPTLMGVAGSITTQVVDANDETSPPEPVFQIAAQDVEQVGKIREAGVPIDPDTIDPTGYTLLAGAQQVQIHRAPIGEITLDASRTGASFVPPSPVDALGGDGDPFVDGGGGDIVGWGRYKDDAGIPDTTPLYSAPGRVAFPQNSNTPQSHIVKESAPGVPDPVVIGGQRYRVSATVYYLPPVATGGFQAILALAYGSTIFDAYTVSGGSAQMNSAQFWAGNPAGSPRQIEFTFVSAITHAPNVVFYGVNNVSGSPALIGDLTFIELPNIDDTGDDIEVEDSLAGLALADLMTMAIETDGGLPRSVWAREDAELIDTLVGARPAGVWFPEQVTIRQALERILVGWSAGLYRRRDGRAGVLRLKLPEEDIGSEPLTVTAVDMFEPGLKMRPDHARGLTRVLGVRKNYRPLTDADQDTDALTLAQRARLAQDFRFTVATGANFAPGYDHAYSAATLDTPLWFPEHGQDEIDFAGRAYAIPRAFYEFAMPYTDAIDIGTLLLLQYPRLGLDDGVPVIVVALDEDRVNQRFERVVCWGMAPPDDLD